jgi:hypothetical protein
MPITTPRSVEDILDSIEETTRSVDPQVDIRKGPIAVANYAHANELARTESQTGYLRTVYQLSRADELEDEDIAQLALNYGKDANVGRASEVLVHLFRRTRPEEGQVATAEAGTLVGSSDGRFVFTTLDEARMDGNFADVFFDAENRRYEIAVKAEAIAIGNDFDLPPGTINRLITPLEEFDGVVNKDFARRGQDPIDKFTLRNLIWGSLQGIDRDVVGNIFQVLSDIDPRGFDVLSFVASTDLVTFQRRGFVTGKVGYDVYLISENISEDIQNGVADGGETTILLDKRPVAAVNSVVVDGVAVPSSVDVDTNPAFAGSPRSNDRVSLLDPLEPASNFQIIYQYFTMVYEGNDVFVGREKVFGADVLVRRANPIDVFVSGTVSVSSTANRDDVIEDLRQFTEEFLNDPEVPSARTSTFVEVLDPVDYVETAERSVDGLLSFKLDGFVRPDRAFLDVEIITFDGKTEFPVLSPAFSVR